MTKPKPIYQYDRLRRPLKLGAPALIERTVILEGRPMSFIGFTLSAVVFICPLPEDDPLGEPAFETEAGIYIPADKTNPPIQSDAPLVLRQ